jgi:ArsR family transcriptional regulator, arsenate/arsenite/antimonite-responsive transcriptional repressor
MIEMSEKQNRIKVEGHVQGCCDPVPVRIPEATDEQVRLMGAMSDPTRLQIVAMLAGQDEPLCVCEIQANFQLGQPTISHHLKVLRDARLVTWEKRGLWVYYSLDRTTLERAAGYLSKLLSLSNSPVAIG